MKSDLNWENQTLFAAMRIWISVYEIEMIFTDNFVDAVNREKSHQETRSLIIQSGR